MAGSLSIKHSFVKNIERYTRNKNSYRITPAPLLRTDSAVANIERYIEACHSSQAQRKISQHSASTGYRPPPTTRASTSWRQFLAWPFCSQRTRTAIFLSRSMQSCQKRKMLTQLGEIRMRICVDGVHELGVRGVQSYFGRHLLEVRFGWIQGCVQKARMWNCVQQKLKICRFADAVAAQQLWSFIIGSRHRGGCVW